MSHHQPPDRVSEARPEFGAQLLRRFLGAVDRDEHQLGLARAEQVPGRKPWLPRDVDEKAAQCGTGIRGSIDVTEVQAGNGPEAAGPSFDMHRVMIS